MKDEFIKRIENRIKQKEGIIKEYQKVIQKNKRNKQETSYLIYNAMEEIHAKILELYNVIEIYRECLKQMKGGKALK